KNKVLPEPLKQFEKALAAAGINTQQDVNQLVFATYKTNDGLRAMGVAQGAFPAKALITRLTKQKVKGERYHGNLLYPMGPALTMTLLDDSTMIFGDKAAVRRALDVRDGTGKSMTSNSEMMDLMSSVESESVWSVLDTEGTQVMLKSALGDAAELADYNMVKNRLKGSRYTLKFDRGLDFDLNVITSDSITAASVSSLLKAGVLFRKATASENEKLALESVEVKSDNRNIRLQFKADDNKFQALLNSELFAAVSK
ncbi:MAG TPA: hypothetical protein VM056_04170, partial [Terriglobales bacterium]|nr:hypothetical protein [Terriglobales bacterium]